MIFKKSALLIVYDNDSYISTAPMGIAYIAAFLKARNWNVTIFEQNINHLSNRCIEEHLDRNQYELVGMGVVAGYYQYRKLVEISGSVNRSATRKGFKYILGGHGVSADPEYFKNITRADKIIVGKGGNELLKYLGEEPIKEGIYPAWEMFSINHYALNRYPGFDRADRMMPVISGWGCPYTCNFCYRMIKGYEPREIIDIVKEIRHLQMRYDITAIDFCDELLMINEKRTLAICEALKPLNIKWACNGRLNFANKKVLKAMKDAGCKWINYGIESLDDKMLKVMNKNLTVAQIIKGVENTLEVGIYPGLNVIWGNIGETVDILWKGVEFLKKYNDGYQLRTIRFCSPYPGSDLFYYCIKRGLLKDVDDFYKKHINSDLLTVNFTKHTDQECYDALRNANNELIADYYEKNKQKTIDQCNNLYNNKDATFRGFREV